MTWMSPTQGKLGTQGKQREWENLAGHTPNTLIAYRLLYHLQLLPHIPKASLAPPELLQWVKGAPRQKLPGFLELFLLDGTHTPLTTDPGPQPSLAIGHWNQDAFKGEWWVLLAQKGTRSVESHRQNARYRDSRKTFTCCTEGVQLAYILCLSKEDILVFIFFLMFLKIIWSLFLIFLIFFHSLTILSFSVILLLSSWALLFIISSSHILNHPLSIFLLPFSFLQLLLFPLNF
jgi:hypothetical protein